MAILAIVMATISYQWLWGSDTCCETSPWEGLVLIGLLIASFIVASLLVASIEKRFRSFLSARPTRLEDAALARIREFSARQPTWGLRVYRTPAGIRVLASHARSARVSSKWRNASRASVSTQCIGKCA